MTLRIVHDVGHGDVPTFFCAHCQRPIRSASAGVYAWDWTGEAPVVEFAHKKCLRSFERERSRFQGVMGLDVLVVYLRNSLKVDMEEAERCATFMANFEYE